MHPREVREVLSSVSSGVSKVLGWEAGAEHKYPTSTLFNAQRLLPCCSDTRLLFFPFVIFLGGI